MSDTQTPASPPAVRTAAERTATRLGIPSADLTTRQIQLIRELTAHGWRFADFTGDPVRYIIEAFVPDPQPGEWDWLENFYRGHPEILAAGGRPSQAEAYAAAKAEGRRFDSEAAAAVRAGDYRLARDLIDAAEWWDWRNRARWEHRRQIIADREQSGAGS